MKKVNTEDKKLNVGMEKVNTPSKVLSTEKKKLSALRDNELLVGIKDLVRRERELLVQVLEHLSEVKRRRLYSDLGYSSLFAYTVGELAYSEGQAGRRMQAMQAIHEMPELEPKVASGELSLSNISQAQSYFRQTNQEKPAKLEVFKSLENKSAREGQKILLSLQPEAPLPKERERAVTETHSEMRFILSPELKAQLEEVRSLLGPKGAVMSFAKLVATTAKLAATKLKEKKFGKKRAAALTAPTSELVGAPAQALELAAVSDPMEELNTAVAPTSEPVATSLSTLTEPQITANPQAMIEPQASATPRAKTKPQASGKPQGPAPGSRYISSAIKHLVWARDRARCTKCGSRRNLNIDHCQPIARGGDNSCENLRLLCFNCNQREAIRVFGIEQVHARAGLS